MASVVVVALIFFMIIAVEGSKENAVIPMNERLSQCLFVFWAEHILLLSLKIDLD